MSILSEIVANKHLEVEKLKKLKPLLVLPKKPNFLKFENFDLIAEIKAQSPSSGIIRKDFDPIKLAQDFEKLGVKAISVLTDDKYFGGSLETLQKVQKNVSVPILRKDFVVDSYQIYETKNSGASIILLILKILKKDHFYEFLKLSLELNLQVLVEIFDGAELELALAEITKLTFAKNQIIFGVNNRNLETFETKIENCLNLSQFIPPTFPKIALSGVKNIQDLEIIKKANYNGVLIGEGLVKNPELFDFFNQV